MMMARQDDRRIFSRDIRLNVLSLQETEHLDLPKLWQDLNLSGDWTSGATQDMFGGDLDLSSFEADNRYQLLQRNIERFKQAKTFGSLIEVPAAECEALKELHDTMLELSESGDSIQRAAAGQIVDVVHQALLLSIRYDAVVANPPYMGNKGLSTYLKKFLGLNYQGFNKDLFLAFISNCINLCASKGLVALMTPNVWMYLNTYTKARNSILENTDINSLIELPLTGFKGATVQICCFVLDKSKASSFKGTYVRLVDEKGADIEMAEETRNCLSVAIHKNKFIADQCDFALIPASPISYWVSNTIRHLFTKGDSISDFVRIREGLNTGDNDRFLRYWWEVDNRDVDFEYDQQFNKKWSKHNKGGSFRRWYGNHDYIMNWLDGGEDIHEFHDLPLDYNGAPVRGKAGFFKSSISWSRISSGKFSARFFPEGFTYDSTAPSIFGDKSVLKYLLGFLNSNMSGHLLSIMSPTVDYRITNLNRLPVRDKAESLVVDELVTKAIVISKNDWDSYENSWDFLRQEMVSVETSIINDALYNLVEIYDERVKCLIAVEEKINSYFIKTFEMEDSLNNEVVAGEVSLFRKYVSEKESRKILLELISYAVGCMMGRYSLDQEGLVYAHAGNEGFDASLYQTFAADSDGIIPITDEEWFKDDVSNRVVEFVKTVWGEDNLTENLQFIADSLCLDAIKPKNSETAVATIRRYLSTQFYKDHMQTYKNRPIYWLFSSGKEKAFECLVYLHRYNESTLSRMRTEYVTPLLGKYEAYAEQLDKQIEMAESTQDKKRLERELKSMDKKQSELREFDDKLKHYADMRISIDLDDGVKENYGKFGDLLAEVKKITGEKPEIINAN